MKIAMLTECPLFFGGGERHVYEISKRLVLAGHEVDIMHPYGHSQNVSEPISVRSAYAPRYPILHYFSVPFLVNFSLAEYDILHVHGLSWVISHLLAAVLTKELEGTPVVCTFHMTSNLERWPWYPFEDLLLESCLRHVDAFIAVSNEHGEKWSEVCNKEIAVIPNGVDTNRFNPNVNGESIKKRLGIHGKFTVLYVGRLAKQKGLEYLLRAVPITLKETKDIAFLIAGEGGLKKELEALAQQLGVNQQVKFLDFIPDSELPKYYAACDVFVLPSVYEPFGMVLLEAMAAGKPVVATAVGGIPEIVFHGKNGFLVKPKEPKELANAILTLSHHHDLAMSMGQVGRRIVERDYSWEIITARVVKLYEKTLRGKKSNFENNLDH